MSNEFDMMGYVYEQRNKGMSESQIAKSLGMSLKHFTAVMNGKDAKQEKPQMNDAIVYEVPKTEKKIKPVSGAGEVTNIIKNDGEIKLPKTIIAPLEEDYSWMD